MILGLGQRASLIRVACRWPLRSWNAWIHFRNQANFRWKVCWRGKTFVGIPERPWGWFRNNWYDASGCEKKWPYNTFRIQGWGGAQVLLHNSVISVASSLTAKCSQRSNIWSCQWFRNAMPWDLLGNYIKLCKSCTQSRWGPNCIPESSSRCPDMLICILSFRKRFDNYIEFLSFISVPSTSPSALAWHGPCHLGPKPIEEKPTLFSGEL